MMVIIGALYHGAVRSIRRRRLLAAVAIAVTAGCQADQVGADRELWFGPDTPLWTVDNSATVSVNAVGMPRDTIPLFGINIAMYGDHGDILVAFGRTEQAVISLDTLGQLRWRAGRTGDGPGEFRAVSDLVSVGDTTYVWDGSRSTIAVFEGATFMREIDVAAKGGRRVKGIVNDSLILAAPGIIAGAIGQPRRYEMWNLRAARVEADEAEAVLGWTVPQGNLATLAITYDGGGRTARTDLPACIAGMIDVSIGDVLYVANVAGASGRIYALELGSGSRRVVYETRAKPIVTELLVEDIRARFGKLGESARRPSRGPGGAEVVHTNVRLVEDSVAAILSRIGAPGAAAGTTWMDLIADESTGHLWLRRAVCAEEGDQEWEVIDTEGRLVARAVLPHELQVRDVKYPGILVTTADTLGVEQLGILKLQPATFVSPKN